MHVNQQQNERFTALVRQYPDFIQYLEKWRTELVDTMVNTDDSKVMLMQGKARSITELLKFLKSLA